MKVFGIGLNKTGTTSLGRALEIIGYKQHITCDWELTKAWFDGNIDLIYSRADTHNNFEDWPWPLMYKELNKKYPNSKFILTTRTSAESWFQSLCNHSLRTGPTEFRKLIYGHYMPQKHKDEHIKIYNTHIKQVTEYFNDNYPEKFINVCWENGDSWDSICSFLNKPIPEQAFPFLNKSKKGPIYSHYLKMKMRMKQLFKRIQ